jgi:replication factor C subunit 3/5
MLFIDKYNIESEDDIAFNHDSYRLARLLSQNETIPHLMIAGNQGVGKKSLVNYYIKQKFGLERIKTNLKNISIKCSNKEIDFNFMYSNYHYLIEPSKYGVYDKQIIQFLLNDILKYKPINKISYHLIVVNNADRLTTEAQQSLRRTLEKFIHNCRFIFLVNNNNSMIDPIRSRCLIIKLNSPTKDETGRILAKICREESIEADPTVLAHLAGYNRNLKESINQLQLLSTLKVDLTSLPKANEHLYLNDNCFIIMTLLRENAHRDIEISDLIRETRQLVQDMLTECVDPIFVIKKIFFYLFDYLSNSNCDQLACLLIKHANRYTNGIKNCNKPIYYIEGFCLQIYDLLDQSSCIPLKEVKK